jgi:arginase family enzyme
MSLAVLVGHCYRNYWAKIGDATPVAEDAVVLLGVRDLSPEAERDRLAKSAVEVVPWLEGRAQGDVEAALDKLARRVHEVYLHVDMDVFDPEVAPGVVDEPVPGGLTLEDAERVMRAIGARFLIRAATIATFTPDRDRDGRTLRSALRVVELLGEWASSTEFQH